MKRIVLAVLVGVTLLGGQLVATPASAAPASAGAPNVVTAGGGCVDTDRHEFRAVTEFHDNECYATPGGFFLMQNDGNFVNYDRSGAPKCASNTDGLPGAYVVFQHDGNLVIIWPGYGPVKHSATHGNDGATLVYNYNGRLRIRTPDRVLWDMCRDGFKWV